jgi:hypothetical protein
MKLIDLSRQIEKILSSRDFAQRFGERARQLIWRRVKSGGGVSAEGVPNPTSTNIADVTSRYAQWRQRVINRGKFFPRGQSSNLTLTGQMLDALDWRVTNNGFQLFIKNTPRKPIELTATKNIKSKRLSIPTPLTNQDVAGHAGEKRPFLALTDREQRILITEMQDYIARELQRINKLTI